MRMFPSGRVMKYELAANDDSEWYPQWYTPCIMARTLDRSPTIFSCSYNNSHASALLKYSAMRQLQRNICRHEMTSKSWLLNWGKVAWISSASTGMGNESCACLMSLGGRSVWIDDVGHDRRAWRAFNLSSGDSGWWYTADWGFECLNTVCANNKLYDSIWMVFLFQNYH